MWFPIIVFRISITVLTNDAKTDTFWSLRRQMAAIYELRVVCIIVRNKKIWDQ